jgi:hypothetical protein
MGKANFFLGAEGQGANMKLVVNAIMGAMMASFAEGMSLANEVRFWLVPLKGPVSSSNERACCFAGVGCWRSLVIGVGLMHSGVRARVPTQNWL